MLPFLNMRLYNRNNYMQLQPYIEKMKSGQLTLENILEEDEIIQDLKTNQNSQFLSMLSHEAIRKLIDYATKLPQTDDQKIGHKFPFNATELLCCDNCVITERILNGIEVAEDSEEEEKEDEEKGENNEEEKKEEDNNEEFVEVKEDEGNQEKKKEEEPKKEEEGVPNKDEGVPNKEEEKKEEPKKEEQPKTEGETKPAEEPKKEEETKKEEQPKTEGESKPVEEPKKEEETKKEEQPKTEGETKPAEEPKKEEQPKTEGESKPAEEPKNEEPKKEEETKKEEQPQTEGESKPEEEPKIEEENKNKEKTDDEEKGQQKHQPKQEEEKEEENDNENDDDSKRENQGEEDSERKQPKINIIYDNVDYLLQFLNSSEETKLNYVLVGYFYKILNHLFSYKSSRIIQYLFDYPKKSEFDPLDLLVKNMNRKSMGEIINKLLLFQEENYGDFTQKKMQLFERVLQELKDSKEESKYECICSTLENTLYNKGFFIEFMKDGKLTEILYTILEESKDQPKKLIAIMKLLIKINENALKFVESRVTNPLTQENPMDFINMFSNNYPLDDEVKDPNADTDELVKKMFVNTFNALEKNKFNFLEDLDDYSSSENSEFTSTYLIKQKKVGMKKVTQTELFRTLLDILVNANSFNNNEGQIKKIVEIMNEKKLFWKLHKLFFDFPFSNVYQTLYSQIMDIVLNESAPDNLIDFVLTEKGEKEETKLIQKLIDEILNNMKFTFTVSDRIAFHPNFSFEISILNKIYSCKNEFLRDLIKDNKNLEVFNTVIGDEVNKIYEQKLLLSENEIQFGSHDDSAEEKKPMSYFGKKNFMEVIDEDLEIYKIYLQGGDFNKALGEKREKERIERENMEKEKLAEEKKKMEEDGYFNNEEEETDDKKNDLKGSINMNQDEEEENNENREENNENNEDNENEPKPEENKEDSSTEESEKDKFYNDVNFWRAEVMPNDEILSSILKDLD